MSPTKCSGFCGKYHRTSKCVSSKSVLLALLWVFVIYLIYILAYQPANYLSNSPIDTLVGIYAINAVVLCLFPIAGFLADTKIGRYKMVTKSLYLLFASLVLAMALIFSILILGILHYSLKGKIFTAIFSLAVFPTLLLTASFIGLVSNIVQFGMDQLHDSPASHQSLFIYWFLWVYYLAFLISQVLWYIVFEAFQTILSITTSLAIILFLPAVIAMVILVVSLITAARHPQWFLMDTAKFNPYKLVYKVSQFSRLHKVPLQRSAFTYHEDEIPRGLDLGKSKYGGPFTTEEVEDVKVFFGILKVLFVLMPTQFLNVAVDPLLYYYSTHVSEYYNESRSDFTSVNSPAKKYLIQGGMLSSILVVIGIPAYLWLVQPCIFSHLPGMLTRMGLGMVLRVMSLICTLVMDITSHLTGHADTCMFSEPLSSLPQNISPVVIQRILFSVSNVVIYAALNEFICSQSPHSMKGMLLGLSFAIRGVSEFLAVVLILPFSYIPGSFPSCGVYYYIMSIAVWIIAFIGYLYVAKKYRYRQRDELCNVYHYAEEYYSKTQDESINYKRM